MKNKHDTVLYLFPMSNFFSPYKLVNKIYRINKHTRSTPIPETRATARFDLSIKQIEARVPSSGSSLQSTRRLSDFNADFMRKRWQENTPHYPPFISWSSFVMKGWLWPVYAIGFLARCMLWLWGKRHSSDMAGKANRASWTYLYSEGRWSHGSYGGPPCTLTVGCKMVESIPANSEQTLTVVIRK